MYIQINRRYVRLFIDLWGVAAMDRPELISRQLGTELGPSSPTGAIPGHCDGPGLDILAMSDQLGAGSGLDAAPI